MFLILVPLLILLAASLVMLVIRLYRPRFAYFWLVAAWGVLLSWPSVLLARLRLPLELPLMDWQPAELFPLSPVLLMDRISWPFALSLATLVLAVILTDVARAAEADWRAWANSMTIAALGILAVLAGNPLTLLLAWAIIDLIELIILLGQVRQSRARNRVVVAFSARVAGILLVIWAGAVARASGSPLTFSSISPQISVYLLLAAGLRLGVLPLHMPFLQEVPLRRGLGTLLRLVPVAASLVMLVRSAAVGAPASLSPYLVFLAGLAALYGGLSWASANDELDGRPFWILGMAALSVAAAARAQPEASLAWGIALLLSGGLLFLSSARHRFLLPLSLLGLLGISALPFTPAWQGVRLYSPPFSPILPIFLIAQALLMIGYLRHALQPGHSLAGMERWTWVIYPWGLALLPLAHFVISWWGQPGLVEGSQIFPSLISTWPALAILILAGLMVAWNLRAPLVPLKAINSLRQFFSFNWLYSLLWNGYHTLGRVFAFINLIFEGEGGILWTLLLLTLLLSLLVQRSAGG